MRIQQALALGILAIFLLMAVGQLGTLWWFQQQLQQQLTTQSGELSKLVLARTAEKLQLVTHNISAEGHSFVFNTNDQAQLSVETDITKATNATAATKNPTPANKTQQIKVIKLDSPTTDVIPGVLQQELEQILVELKTDQPTSTQWVQRFKVERRDSSQQLLQQYLGYQVMALAVSEHVCQLASLPTGVSPTSSVIYIFSVSVQFAAVNVTAVVCA